MLLGFNMVLDIFPCTSRGVSASRLHCGMLKMEHTNEHISCGPSSTAMTETVFLTTTNPDLSPQNFINPSAHVQIGLH